MTDFDYPCEEASRARQRRDDISILMKPESLRLDPTSKMELFTDGSISQNSSMSRVIIEEANATLEYVCLAVIPDSPNCFSHYCYYLYAPSVQKNLRWETHQE